MPELPEVQTVVNDLNEKIKNETIVDFWSDWPSAIKNSTLKNFQKNIQNRKILRARRIGKNIFLDLSGPPTSLSRSAGLRVGEKTLYIHLKMTGHLLVKQGKPLSNSPLKKGREKKEEDYFTDRVNQYIHHIWKLKSGKTLEFSDLRKFAKILLVDTEKIFELPEIKKLGIDALDEKFTFEKFQEILGKKSQMPIGKLLMEQNLIAGIGNIYRSEILFAAKIHPERKAKDMKIEERKRLFQATRKILEKAVKMRGTSDSDYRDTSGAPGGFQKVLNVYNREGRICQVCQNVVKRKKMAQRSVFFCDKCQN